MRIIGGHFKGRTLQTPDGKGTRPTDARSREMLFNVLGELTFEARVLDLYGGTGALGLEALSRGAEFCIFIEQNAGACRAIKANLKALQVAGAAQVWQSTVKGALRRLAADEARIDLIFADPPFSNARELGDLCKSLDMAASLLHNKPRLHPDADSLPFPSPSTSDVLMRTDAAAREESLKEDAPHAVELDLDGSDPDDFSWDGSDEDEPEPAASLVPQPMLVIQHHRKQSPVLQAPFRLWREKRAGESTLSFFVLDEEGEEGTGRLDS